MAGRNSRSGLVARVSLVVGVSIVVVAYLNLD
jgi:hypothetical protein